MGSPMMGQVGNRNCLWHGSGLTGIMPSLLPFLLRFLAILIFVGSTLGAHAEPAVGVVSKAVNPAEIGSKTAVVGASVQMNDRLRTGANGRLQITFRDQSVLTLGEKADVVVDRYVYNPSKSKGELVLKATQGAFRFAGGKLEDMNEKKVIVSTPYAAMAVRGTDFWAGPIYGQYGVLLLKGKVGVSNQGGAVTLASPGMGTDIPLRHRKTRR